MTHTLQSATTASHDDVPPLAARVDLLSGEGALDVFRRATELEHSGRSIVHLELGAPDVDAPTHVVDAAVAALRAGLESAKGDILVLMDADGSMDGRDIEAFRDALVAGADYVKGSRFVAGGGSTDITRLRRFGDAGICLLLRVFFGAHYSDGTYGFKALWATKLSAIRIDTDGFEVELLIDIRAHRAGLQTAEVPCFETNRIHGASNLNAMSDGLRCLRVIVRERLRRYRVPTN